MTTERHWREIQAEDLATRFLSGKTPGQNEYLKALNEKEVVLCSGPAGTGKTHISVGVGIRMLHEKKVNKIIFSRPLVTCGDKMGFFPGTPEEKARPYMQAIQDVVEHFVSGAEATKLIETKALQFVPLELMRGLTFKHTFFCLDEAQGATYAQLRMLLTRFGTNSRFVINGDASQSDVPGFTGRNNPFLQVVRRLRGLNWVREIWLTRNDIVRDFRVKAMDERLSGREGGGANTDSLDVDGHLWLMERCPRCDARIWYDDGAGDVAERVVECWQCGSAVTVAEDEVPFLSSRKDITAYSHPLPPV